jgi:type 1 fimbriae regulatory protein FimB
MRLTRILIFPLLNIKQINLNNTVYRLSAVVIAVSRKTSLEYGRTRDHLTSAEVDSLLAASKVTSRNPVRDYCALLLAYRHGLRVSELCAIKLSDINVDTKEFHVYRSKDGDSGVHELYNGESQAVKAWLLERAKLNPPADCDTLFISERRKPLSRCTVWLMIGNTAKAAGLEHLKIHPHALRHSCGYALINKPGVGVRVIQEYLGHRSISSTVRYTKLDSKAVRQAVLAGEHQ